MAKAWELILGIILLVVGIWGIYYFSVYGGHSAVRLITDAAGNQVVQISPVLVMIEACWGFIVALIGLVFFALGISELRG
ncbi:MAG: hypothetical protein KJ767_02995 [Nanoarchaeota archaeon]|nr:hypothetical protein [Nanoarchaeota archaeon]